MSIIHYSFGKTKNFSQIKDSIFNYYANKNKAEEAILDSNYTLAFQCYQKAFTFKEPNGRDLYNAFITAYMQRDSSKIKEWFNQIILHGQELKKFELGNYIKAIKQDALYQWVSADYDSLRKIALNSNMHQLALSLDSILNDDQKVRPDKPGKPQIPEERIIMAHVDSLNCERLKIFIQRYGFPDYQKVGLFDSALEGKIDGLSTFSLVAWHTRRIYKGLNEMALEAVKKGDFPPDNYALMVDAQDGKDMYMVILPKDPNNSNNKFNLPPNTAIINQNRHKIYLEDLQVFRRKLIYQDNHDHWFMLTPMWIQALNDIPFKTTD